MQQKILEQLEWPLLLEQISRRCQTEGGRERTLRILPDLDQDQVETRWREVEPLKALADDGNAPPIGELPDVLPLARAASLGQVLAGTDFMQVRDLLDSTQRVLQYAEMHQSRCGTLARFSTRLYGLPTLVSAIDRSIGTDGEVRDDATPELAKLRKQKVSLRKRIENRIQEVLRGKELEKYLQDDFFTKRAERYVVPMRLDGRGRIAGSIVDTSASGQTLFIEPQEIGALNQELMEIELSEKLEVARILRELSKKMADEHTTIEINYNELIDLDFLWAQGAMAARWRAYPVQLCDTPTIEIKEGRHPLLMDEQGQGAIGNHIELSPEQATLIISGPNAGGKTVVLKTVGLLQLMAKSGLLVPAERRSKMRLFERIFLEMGDSQDLSANLSTFSAHIKGLKPIIEQATSRDLVLLDEIAVGTEPQTGSAIAQSIIEALAGQAGKTIVTTHFDRLKGLAVQDKRFRNGSMEYSLDSLRPTYRLILDVPGQSYGLEVAQQMGLPSTVVQRAKNLRGSGSTQLEDAVSQLMTAREQVRQEQHEVAKIRREAEQARDRWEQERSLLEETRRKTRSDLAQRVEKETAELRANYDQLNQELKRLIKAARSKTEGAADSQTMQTKRKEVEQTLEGFEAVADQLQKDGQETIELPGMQLSAEEAQEKLKAGASVFVVPLGKEGSVTSVSGVGKDSVEVQVGLVKLKVPSRDLRWLPPTKPERSVGKRQTSVHEKKAIPFTPETPTNTLDLRGMDSDDATKAMWQFLDQAVLRGEHALLVIHGHGTDRLKKTIRGRLSNDCPYQLQFRPGEAPEGGDGVTVIQLL